MDEYKASMSSSANHSLPSSNPITLLPFLNSMYPSSNCPRPFHPIQHSPRITRHHSRWINCQPTPSPAVWGDAESESEERMSEIFAERLSELSGRHKTETFRTPPPPASMICWSGRDADYEGSTYKGTVERRERGYRSSSYGSERTRSRMTDSTRSGGSGGEWRRSKECRVRERVDELWRGDPTDRGGWLRIGGRY